MSRVGQRQRPFRLVIFACAQFILLTFLAMLLYPGGNWTDPHTERYLFLRNFFSDLGLIVAHNGEPNWPAAALFVIALTGAGLGLIAFFLTAPRLFRHSRAALALSRLGSLFGVACGLSYIGVAFTPADRLMAAHVNFVYAAFTSFLVVVIFYGAAIMLHGRYPRRYAAAYALFAVLLAVYLWLLFFGPDIRTDSGLVIQATGQKVIAYASVVVMLYQAYGAQQAARETAVVTAVDAPQERPQSAV